MFAILAYFVVGIAAYLTGVVQFASRVYEVKNAGPWIMASAQVTPAGGEVQLRNDGKGPALYLSMELTPDGYGVSGRRLTDALGPGQDVTMTIPSAFLGDVGVTVEFRDRLGRYHRANRKLARGGGAALHLFEATDWIRVRAQCRWRSRLPASWL